VDMLIEHFSNLYVTLSKAQSLKITFKIVKSSSNDSLVKNTYPGKVYG